MQLSDISSQKLSPGRYLITASYDGDVQYNPAEAQLVLVIDANGEASYETRPIDDAGEMPVVKVSPNVQFTPSTLSIVEKNLDKYPFNWRKYFSNPYNVGYSVYVSTGLTLYEDNTIGWESSGTYVLTVVTNETDLYTSQTVTLTMNVTSKINPRIEYVNDNNEFTLQDGIFTKRYYNIEKREGVYMFDLLQPTNPYALPLKYKIDDNVHGTINVDDNKIYISAEGKYKIIAYYEGDDTYRSSITYYILKYYEGEGQTGDEPNPQKISPNLSFVFSNVTQDKKNDNRYKVLQLINPYNVSGGTWLVSKGNITNDGTIITYDGTGSLSVSYIFNGNDKYLPQTVSYILNIKSDDNPDNLPLADIGFTNLIVTVDENEEHEYPIQYAYNNSGVAIDYYYNDTLIENGILKTASTGNLIIVGQSKNNGTFAATKIYYTLQIVKHQQQDPEISFDSNSIKEYQTNNFEYLLQFVSNPHNVELEWSSSKGVITDNILYFEELGTVVITVKSKPTFYYSESIISYTLEIEESQKLSPELSFDDEAQFFNSNDNNKYQVQSVNNPHNVELRWFSDRGELNSELNPSTLTISSYSGPVNIYCKSVEDDTYKSEMVTYKLYVGTAKRYLQYTKHADYNIEKNQGTFDLEMLRYTKSQNLEFDPTEWRFTSSLQYCTINDRYYVEEGDYIVIMVNVTITKPCNPLISVTFNGNEYFYSSSNIRVHVNLLGKNLLSPEISFSDSYQIVDLKFDYRYLLQDVENPHDVEIVYSSSAGQIDGNYLVYQDKYNVIIKATSVENDIYASQTISYKLEFKEPLKPSSGIHFAQPMVQVTQNNDGIYELQGIVDAEDNPIADVSLIGYYYYPYIGDVSYDDSRGCWVIDKPNWHGDATIKFVIYETETYRKETISYVLAINSNEKPYPELAFDKYQINVTQKSNGTYPIQSLINPHNVPVTWFCSSGEFDDPNNPQNIIFSGREYIRIGVRSQETQEYKQQEQAYGMSILLPSKKDAGLSFDSYQLYTQVKNDGIYPLQIVNNPNNVSPLTYSVSKGVIEGDNIIYNDGVGELTVTVSYPGDDVYEAVNLRYTMYISGNMLGYLEVEGCQNIEMTGELNQDIDVQLVRWSVSKQYTFNPADWRVTSSHYRCTYKTIKTEEINGYVYLIGTFSFKAEGTSYITTSFKGNEDFNSDEGHGLWIEYTVPTVVDDRVIPSISFNNYMVHATQNSNYMYLLQTLNKPDDVEIDHWELNYGGDDFNTAQIIDDEYVYYEGTDYVNVKVFTKESDVYKQTSDSYTLYVNEKTKTGTSIYFVWDTINANRRTDGIYSLQSAHTSPDNLTVVWSTSNGEIINNNTQLSYSGDGEVTITASFAGDANYEPSSASYKLVISATMQKRYLQASQYKSQSMEVNLGTEYDIPIIKWAVTENLDYNPSEWSLSNSYSTKCVIDHLFTEDEGDYRILKAKCTFTTSGSTYLKPTFKGNDYFYSSNYNGFTLEFNRAADVDVRDPQISWPEPNPDPVAYSDEHLYLIQTPISPYQEVTFNAPTATKSVIEDNGSYYVYTSDTGEVTVTISSKATGVLYEGSTKYMYASKTISYKMTIMRQVIEKTDANLAFDNLEENLDYIWHETSRKLYKVQPLYNPYSVPVIFNPISVGNLLKLDDTVYLKDANQEFTGYIDYGYYVEYDGLADITITVIMQENDYHYSNSNPSYVMHITRDGQEVEMWFSEQTVYSQINNNGLYPIQEVMLLPDISQIRENVTYTLINGNGTLIQNGSQLYLSLSGTGSARILATFEGDSTYAPVEAIYTLRIVNTIKQPAPIDFPETDIYTPKNQYNAYPVQQPQSTDGNIYDLTGHLTWTYPEGWYLNTELTNHMISPTTPITEDTDVLIQCYLEETQFQEKYMQYTLHILNESKVYLNADVHNNYDLDVEENTNLKLELLKWPASQAYVYDATEWAFTRWYNEQNTKVETDISSYITCEQVGDYYVVYYNCSTTDGASDEIEFRDYTIDMSFSGNSGYHRSDWGIYMQLTETNTPEPIEPNIRFNQDIFDYIIWDADTSATLPTPTIVYSPEHNYPIEYTYTYWVATPDVQNPQTYEDFTKVGQGVETSGTTIDNVQEGYYIVDCTTTASDYYNSKTITTVLSVTRQYNRVDPTISLSNTSIKIVGIQSYSTFIAPTVTNTSNVEYKWYINGNEITVTNNQFSYTPTSNSFVLELRTTQTNQYNSISLYCNYINISYEEQYFTIESLEDNNEMIWKINEEQANAYTPTTIHYSTDLENWTSIVSSLEGTYICTLNAGEKVYFKGPLTYRYTIFSDGTVNNYDYRNNQFVSNGNFNVSGNIMSLVYGDDFRNKHDFYNIPYRDSLGSCLYALFRNSRVINAEHLILPATTLPETHSNNPYYSYMFHNCTSLIKAPKLPATTLGQSCYLGMFEGCTSLVNAPELPAATLADSCYIFMFRFCTSLSSIKILATDISATDCLFQWLDGVSPTGTFTKKSGVNYPTGDSGIPQGWTVINI